MLRTTAITLLTVSSCALCHAQEQAYRMLLRQPERMAQEFAADEVDSLTFDALTGSVCLHTKKGEVEVDELDSVTFYPVEHYGSYAAVDLGLSVKWATCNLGAKSAEQYGQYYAWGETSWKRNYTEPAYRYYENEQYQYIGVNICGSDYDTATHLWGDPWRMPTRGEVNELQRSCRWTAETLSGTRGYRVTAPNGSSIFLPAAGYKTGTRRTDAEVQGYYWTGTLDRTMPSSAYNLNFQGYDADWPASRAYGFSIRAVR